MPTITDKKISSYIDKLRDEVVRHGKPIVVSMSNGQVVEVSCRYVSALRARENTLLTKSSRSSRKLKDVSPEKRGAIVDKLQDKVSHSLQNTVGVKISDNLRTALLKSVRLSLSRRRDCPKTTTFAPRLLFFIDDHFASFIGNVRLGLLEKNFEGQSSAAFVKDLSQMEDSFVRFLRDNQVGASTVLNALVVFYTNTHGLRVKGGEYNSMIEMDEALKTFVRSPMDSLFKGKSLADRYVATSDSKKVGKGSSERLVESLAHYRKNNAKRSVMDYLLSVSDQAEQSALKKGYLMGKHIMSLVSAHLIPASSFDEPDRKALTMDVDSHGHFENPNVNTLIALQAVISASHKGGEQHMAPARSPSRSPARSHLRTPSRSQSRSPLKSKVSQ